VDAPGQIPDHGGLTDFGKVFYFYYFAIDLTPRGRKSREKEAFYGLRL
jgi:hypothetical protein